MKKGNVGQMNVQMTGIQVHFIDICLTFLFYFL